MQQHKLLQARRDLRSSVDQTKFGSALMIVSTDSGCRKWRCAVFIITWLLRLPHFDLQALHEAWAVLRYTRSRQEILAADKRGRASEHLDSRIFRCNWLFLQEYDERWLCERGLQGEELSEAGCHTMVFKISGNLEDDLDS